MAKLEPRPGICNNTIFCNALLSVIDQLHLEVEVLSDLRLVHERCSDGGFCCFVNRRWADNPVSQEVSAGLGR